MAGANGVVKYGYVNREDQFDPLKTRGIEYQQRAPVVVVNTAISADEYLNDLIFNFNSPASPFTGPTAQNVFTLMSQRAPVTLLSRFTQYIENTRGTALVINMGMNFIPSSLTIDPFSNVRITWELFNINPPAYQLYEFTYLTQNGITPPPPSGGAALPPGSMPGDVLQWNGATWLPNTTTGINANLPLITSLGTANWQGNLNLFGRLILNAGYAYTLSGPNDAVIPCYNFGYNSNNQTVMLSYTENTGDPTNVAFNKCSNFCSYFNNVAPLLPSPNPPPPTENIYHFYGGANGGPITGVLQFGVTVSGQVYAGSYNVLCGQDIKKDIEEAPLSSNILKNIRTVRYRYKSQDSDAPKTLGVIAEEIGHSIPDAFIDMKRGEEEARKKRKEQGIDTENDNNPNVQEYSGNYLNMMSLISVLLGTQKHLEERVSSLELQLINMKK